jgi:hypothetical protein
MARQNMIPGVKILLLFSMPFFFQPLYSFVLLPKNNVIRGG